jgi:hypothetical protein
MTISARQIVKHTAAAAAHIGIGFANFIMVGAIIVGAVTANALLCAGEAAKSRR